MSSATQALDLHTSFAIRLGNRGVQNYVSAMCDMAGVAGKYGLTRDNAGPMVAHNVLRSSTIRVGANVVPEIHRTAASYDARTPIKDVALPSHKYGCAVFDEPIRFTDPKSLEMQVHMMTWFPLSVAVRIPVAYAPGHPRPKEPYPFGDPSTFMEIPEDDPGYIEPSIYLAMLWNDTNREIDGSVQEIFAQIEAREGRRRYEEANRLFGGFWPTQVVAFEVDHLIGPTWVKNFNDAEFIRNQGYVANKDGAFNLGRLIVATWDLLRQTVPASELPDEERHVARSARRRAEREGLSSDVSVIVLRREKRPVIEPGTGTKLDHQVTVSGHYRDQPYGPGRKLVKRIWIKGHKRGPEGTPVIDKPKVYDLRR